MTCIAFVAIGIAAIGAVYRRQEAERVASCILDSICPDCGRAAIEDESIGRGGLIGRRRYAAAVRCTSCHVQRRLPRRVRDLRVEQTRSALKAMHERSNVRRLK